MAPDRYQSLKIQMSLEKQGKRKFTDPDPERSRLCYECNDFIRSLHSHPWTDPERVDFPIGRSHLGLQGNASRSGWRSFDTTNSSLKTLVISCALCAIVRDILLAGLQLFQSQESSAPISVCHYLLKPSLYGRAPDLDPRRVFGQVNQGTRKYFQRWCLGIAVTTNPGKSVSYELSSVIQCAPTPVPKFSMTARSSTPFEQRSILHGRLRPLVAYVALSYIWGNKTQVYAPSEEAYAALHQKGALRHVKLSQTVADAVLLVQKLGLRYLWVDALCIQQSSVMDKHDQIAQMGFVYQSASFTIIAAAGNDCDAGLPGLRQETRFKEQKFARAGDYTLMSALQLPGNKILTSQTSKWELRGWTLQEDLLSARQLIFTSEQIWWRCPCATWCESAQLETKDPVGFFLPGESAKSRLEDRYSILKPEQYFKLVADYAGRQLSYASDALNAFSGILSVLTKYSGNRFLWALIANNFERQLYWFGKANVRPGTEKNAFPSWSWISSQGEISFSHYSTYNPTIKCYVIHEWQHGYEAVKVCDLLSDTSKTVTTVSSTSIDVANAEINNENDSDVKMNTHVRMEDIRSSYKADTLEADFHLFFYTYSATFYLMPQGRLILPDLKPRHAYNNKGEIIGSMPDYGHLVPSLDDAELCEKGDRECILLGVKPPASEWDVAHVVVMLVARDDGRLRRRLGIADIPEELWLLADRRWELIALG